MWYRMSGNGNIICKECNMVFSIMIQHDYFCPRCQNGMDEVTNYYPIPEEKAHLINNYICDNCYNNIGNIVKKSLIKTGEEYINNLQERKDKEYQEYLKKITKLEEANDTVKNYYELLKSIDNIYELNNDIVYKIKNGKYPYAIGGTYYLENAIEIEKILKLNMKKIRDWVNEYNINVKRLPVNYNMYDLITKEQLKNILLDCEIEGKTLKQIIELVNKLK